MSPPKKYKPSKHTKSLHERRMGFVPLQDRPHLASHKNRENAFTDPESVLVSDVFPHLTEYTNLQLAEALNVDESRIRRMKKQYQISFRIADELLTFAGVSYMLGNQIRVIEGGKLRHPPRSDATDSQADELA